MNKLVLVVICTMLMFSIPVSAIAEDTEFAIGSGPETVGDFVSYEVNMSGFLLEFYEELQEDFDDLSGITTNNIADMRIELISTSECEFANSSTCKKVLGSSSFNITLDFMEGSDYDEDKVTMRIGYTNIIESDDGNVEWVKDTSGFEVWYAVDGTNYHYVQIEETTQETTYLERSPSIVSLGDSWTERESYESETVIRSRENNEDWEYEYEEEEYETVTSYSAGWIEEVIIDGISIECLKIVSQEMDSNSTFTGYYNENGMPIKMVEIGEDEEIMMIMTLNDYQWENEPLDDDGDGVDDSDDLCPNTSVGETIDANGCAQSQLDDDADGVMNDADLCPNTPTSETVDTYGCSESQLDDDGDGVMNDADLCSNTSASEAADSVGCAPTQYDADNDGVPDQSDQCPSTPIGVNVVTDGCNYPPVCDISYYDGAGNVVSLYSQLRIEMGNPSSSLVLPTDNYRFDIECIDPESDTLSMTVTLNGSPPSPVVFTGFSAEAITVPVEDGMTISKTITYYWTDGVNVGTYEIDVSLEPVFDAEDPDDGLLPGFELWITLLAIIASLFFNRTRKII
jgi:hypothetical protein